MKFQFNIFIFILAVVIFAVGTPHTVEAAALAKAGSLIKFRTDARVFVVADDHGALNLIPTRALFKSRGYSDKQVRTLSDDEFSNYYIRGEISDKPIIFVKDGDSVMTDEQSDEPWSAASITKLLTALVLSDLSLDWDAPVQLTRADELGGARLRVAVGSRYRRIDLLHASLMGSANNATHALARTSGISLAQFVGRMNKKAEQLGMVNSRFVDPTGLDPQNISTAQDIALLIEAAHRETRIADIGLKTTYTLSSIARKPQNHTITTTNLLLRSGDPVGLGKTGFLYESRYNFTVVGDGATGRARTVVVMNCPTKASAYALAKKYIYQN